MNSTGGLRNSTLYSMLVERAESTPNSIAIVASEQLSLTYIDLLKEVNRVIAQITALNLSPQARIALVFPNGPDMAIALLAIASIATCAPLNPAYRAAEFEFYLSDLQAQALVVPAQTDSSAIAVAQTLRIPILELAPLARLETQPFIAGQESQIQPQGWATQPHDVALVLHTSGTTARPKIVPLTHRNLCCSAHNIQVALGLTTDDRCLNMMPLFHIHGFVGVLLSSLVAGGSIVCLPGFHATQFYKDLAAFHSTWYSAVPTMHQAILDHFDTHRERLARSTLRFIRSSSAALPPAVIAKLEFIFEVPVIEAYGMTEAAHQMASNPLPPSLRKPGSVGRPTGVAIAIMDEFGNVLPPQELGEIVIRGETVMQGYENNLEANAKAFTNGWFRTGDQGYLDDEGYLFLKGRLKELINRGGEKVAPQDIDTLLMELPEISQAVTFAIPHPSLGEDIVSAVVLKPKAQLTEHTVRQFLFERIANFKVPSQVIFVEAIPQGPTGKLQRIGLADRFAEQLQQVYVSPSSLIEGLIAQTFAEVLGVGTVGTLNNFFALGGDSLRGTQVIARLNEMFELELSPVQLFAQPTVAELATTIEPILDPNVRESVMEIWAELEPMSPTEIDQLLILEDR